MGEEVKEETVEEGGVEEERAGESQFCRGIWVERLLLFRNNLKLKDELEPNGN